MRPYPGVISAILVGSVIAAGVVVAAEPAESGWQPSDAPELVRLRCVTCHAVPDPSMLARDQWTSAMESMKAVMKEQAAVEYPAAEMQAILIYYRTHSPLRLTPLPPDPVGSPLGFAARPIGEPAAAEAAAQGGGPTISNLQVTDLDQDGRNDVLVSDALGGKLSWIHRGGDGWEERVLAEVAAPARATAFDFDGDGDLDIVVAALGSLFPTNETSGSVVLLLNDGKLGFTPRVLADGLGRVADVQPADFDGDGDIDFSVAAFGHITTGLIGWLEQQEDGTFELHTLLETPGGIHVPAADLDGDGDTDVVALVAQGSERIVAFLNDGRGGFQQHPVYEAGTPLMGSSGIALADMDGDGDLDILYTNGDSFDLVGQQVHSQALLRPYHGLRWIENLGSLEFAVHPIWSFYGAFSPVAADLDGDGDMDAMAASMFNDWGDPARQSLFWFENDGNQRFTPHGVANAPTHLVTVDVGDLDGDGRPDAVTGGMHVLGPFDRVGRVTLWHNLGGE
jgi:hypothetical protein